MGSCDRVILVEDALPSKFTCQEDCVKEISDTDTSGAAFVKRKKKVIKKEFSNTLQEPKTTKNLFHQIIEPTIDYLPTTAKFTMSNIQSKMSKPTLCRACLASDIKMCNIANTRFQEVFEKLSTKLCTEGRPETVCYLCYSQLQRCVRFMDMVQKTEVVFTQLFRSGTELNKETISSLHKNHKFIQTPLQYISVNTKENIKEPEISNVKLETVIDKENSLVQIKKEKSEDIEESEPLITCDKIKEENVNVNDGMECMADGNDLTTVNIKEDIEFESCFGDNQEDTEDFYEEIGITNLPKESHKCPLCCKSYGQKSHLNRHIKSHQAKDEYRKYTCEVCGMLFAQKSTYKKHFLRHTNEKPFACTICPARCTQKNDLERHMMKHTGYKPFTCDICKMTFSRKCNMKLHILTHSDSKPFVCYICNSTFGRKYDLNRHMRRKHTGEKPFACDFCDFRSVNASYVKVHVGNKHVKAK